ncbi:aldo/keto reductase family protein [Methylophaga sp. OBS4]|uniref:aldo/keto reductase family protein n=1 Tax=Methylophaga sp. OBS4 TaxID=2991935 RepID=UPI002253D782|nr:aldo/keto reductase [Methylophaga sp. OBS4]MCX4188007.1 aldo/keto reductase [Methylophaga sp. OBS4]
MPLIIYGTAWKKERTTELVLTAFNAGFRGFDTACQPKHYAEPLVGEALKTLHDQGVARADYYLQTKFTPLSGQDPKRVPYDPTAPIATQVAQSFACSQQNLHSDYVDSLILHSPLDTYPRTLMAWHAMEQIQQQGGAQQLGISNCYQLDTVKALYADAEIKPTILQNRFVQETNYDAELRAWCREHSITYQSFWTLTANPHILHHPTMASLAQQHKATPEQILFCYLGQIDIVPLTGTTSVQHMQQDLASFDINLSATELDALAALFHH